MVGGFSHPSVEGDLHLSRVDSLEIRNKIRILSFGQ
jgi:hypothetical protein